MFILRKLELSRLILVILASLISLSTLPLKGYCDENWRPVGKTDDYTDYYNSSSVKIDKVKKIIKVWVKSLYTEKGIINFLKLFEGIEKQKYDDFSYRLTLYFFNYKESKYGVNQVTYYSKSNNVLYNREYPSEWKNIIQWKDIIPASGMDIILNKILKDYKIER